MVPEGMQIQYEAWWQECQQSLTNPLLNVIEVFGDQTISSMFQARVESYKSGNSEYVSHVNDDDLVLGDPFSYCIDVLDSNPALVGVYTNSYIDDGKTRRPFFNHEEWTRKFHESAPRPVHELCVMRRSALEKVLDSIDSVIKPFGDIERISTSEGEQLIYSAVASQGNWKFLPDTFSYMWRKHQHGRHKETFAAKLTQSQKVSVRRALMSMEKG